MEYRGEDKDSQILKRIKFIIKCEILRILRKILVSFGYYVIDEAFEKELVLLKTVYEKERISK